MVIKNKRKLFLIGSLLVCELASVFLTYKSYGNKTLDKVTEENKVDKQQFAMYVQKSKESNDYEVLNDTSFPSNLKYNLNIARSECQDNEGNKISDNSKVISTNGDGKITVTSDKTIYCTFYFDLETSVPSITDFYIGTKKGEEYTNQTSVSYHIEWSDNDIDKYCLTTESNSANCQWQDKSVETIAVDDNHQVNGTTTLSTDQTYTYYAYIKDYAGNESVAKNDQITLDTVPPNPTSMSITGSKVSNGPTPVAGYTHTTGVTVTINWAASTTADIDKYCISTVNNSCNGTWKDKSGTGTSLTTDYALTSNTEGSKTIYALLKDKAGNISTTPGSANIKLDTQNPTVQLSKTGDVETSITVTVTASDTNNISDITCSSTGGTCNCPNITQCKVTGLQAGKSYSITVTATDGSGRIGSNTQTYSTKAIPPAGTVLPSKGDNTLKQGSYGDLKYRYVGTSSAVTKNYICFGTTNKGDCIANSGVNNYMYRIMGIDTKNRLKLIKYSSIGTHLWHSSHSDNTKWSGSTMYTYLNSETSGFLKNSKYVPNTTWENKIDDTTWNTGDVTVTMSDYGSGSTVLEAEKKETLESTKIGLMYLSDYYYAYNDGTGNTNCNSTACTSWMTGTSTLYSDSSYEWTMTREGRDSTGTRFHAWYVSTDGRVSEPYLTTLYAVRPVFYLTSGTTIASGIGTLTDPFILS